MNMRTKSLLVSPSYPRAKNGSLALLRQFYSSLCYHMTTVFLTICNNIPDMVLGGLFFGTVTSFAAPQLSMGPALSPTQLLAAAPRMLLWSWSNIFMFCLHNQRQPANMGEDALNKPWRPMVSGRLSPDQAVRLLYIMHPLCLVISLCIGGFVPYAILTFFHVWYNEFGAAKDGILKSIFNGIGVACFFAGPLEVATRHSILSGNAEGIVWVGLIMALVATTSHIQDFRDMQGDKAAGRRTIPLVMDETAARVLAVAGVGCWTELACRFWGASWIQRSAAWATAALLVANLLLDRTNPGDHRAWRLWSVWVTALFFLPIPAA